jgi:hypothetical protein
VVATYPLGVIVDRAKDRLVPSQPRPTTKDT